MKTATNLLDETTRRALMRLVHGELPEPEAHELARRAEGEPELAAELARLEALWGALELPPAAPAPPDFSARVAARAATLRRGEALSWSLAPAWVRAAAVAALAAGLVLGVGAGLLEPRETVPDAADWSFESAESSLADAYWQALEEGYESGAGEGDGGSANREPAAPEEG